MCGIAGLAGAQEPGWIERMNDALAHRGPDEAGVYRSPEGDLGLAMRRLSILDLATGQQPMASPDGQLWVVFNGEIFNAPALRLELEAAGRRFSTHHSDTEVLLHLYALHGPEMVTHLDGMFAFVLYDARRRRLLGARDRLGIKPLYLWRETGRFAFASELKSLLTLPPVGRRVRLQSLYHYMTLLYVPETASIFEDVERLPPGHRFIYDLERRELAVERYWQPRFQPLHGRSDGEWAEALREKLRDAVRRWTLSDVPIATSLSGGLDSAALVGLLAETGCTPLRTFSLGFAEAQEQPWDELARARQISQRWGSEHTEVVLSADSFRDDLLAMVWHLDEPYGGGLPAWYVFREMRRTVKVGLTGTGGDELFGNYGKFHRYEKHPWLRALVTARGRSPRALDVLAHLATPAAALARRLPATWPWIGSGRSLARLPDLLRRPFGLYYYAHFAYLSDGEKQNAVFVDPPGEETATLLEQLYDAARPRHLRDGLLAVDLRTQLAEEFLMMTDRFSMAHGLEARVPFLDHHLVELVGRIPPEQRTRAGDLKHLFRRAVADLVPAPLQDGPKRGFVLPIELWLRGRLRPLAERLLAPERLARQGIFRPSFHARFVRPHLEGRATFTWPVWAALMFQLWHVLYVEQALASAPGVRLEDVA